VTPSVVSILPALGPSADPELLEAVEQILASCEDLYPGMDVWLRRTAVPGIVAGDRAGFVAYLGQSPIAAAIAKFKGELKLCSLRVLPGHENKGVGTALFAAAASVMAPHGERAFFTAPETLAMERRSFFEGLGFQLAGRYTQTYRRGDAEMAFHGDIERVLHRASRVAPPGLFGWMASYTGTAILLSVRPKYANEILEGRKTVELRRKFSECHVGATVVLYASAPEQSVVGTARISGVRKMRVRDIAATRMESIGCSEQELFEYAHDLDTLMTIELSDVQRFSTPLERRDLEREFGGSLRPPVSHQLLSTESRWSRLRDKLNV